MAKLMFIDAADPEEEDLGGKTGEDGAGKGEKDGDKGE